MQAMFKDEKPAIVDQIATRCQANAGVPKPTLVSAQADNDDNDDDEGDNDDNDDEDDNEEVEAKPTKRKASKAAAAALDDLVERSNLSTLIAADVIEQCRDSAWKIRRDGLEAVGNMLKKHPYVTPDVGDLAPALAERLSDSNKILVTTALEHLAALAGAMGPKGEGVFKAHWLEPIVSTLPDGKDTVRAAATAALDAWAAQLGVEKLLDESLAKALVSGKPLGQRAALGWLDAQLKDTPKAEVSENGWQQRCNNWCE